MFYKKIENDRHVYISINKIVPIREGNAAYNQRHCRLELADGTSAEHTFEATDWFQFMESFKKGGKVFNA